MAGRSRRDRIIPARAGFTPVHCVRVIVVSDHPRSRGVYAVFVVVAVDLHGSSPLARGLRDRPRRGARPARIIPARAGFTVSSSGTPSAPRDHPRSRGVYVLALAFVADTVGSSPLARGLLVFGDELTEPRRIIPARAGFTLFCLSAVRGTWDHPRSRGVYASQFHTVNRQEGSSPLARGLR